MNEAEKKLRAALDKAAEQLRVGYAYFYNCVELRNVLVDKSEIYNIAPAFFWLTLNGWHDSSILYLTSLLDKRKDTLKLENLEKMLECPDDDGADCQNTAARQIRNASKQKFSKSIKEIMEQAKRICKVRHEEIAHLKLQNVIQNKKPEPIHADDVENVYRKIHCALDDVASAFFGDGKGIGMIETVGARDFDELIKVAELGMKARTNPSRGSASG